MRRPISQREAHRLRARVNALEQHLKAMQARWGADFPGQAIGREPDVSTEARVAIQTAQRLGFPVVCRVDNTALQLFAVDPRVRQ